MPRFPNWRSVAPLGKAKPGGLGAQAGCFGSKID